MTTAERAGPAAVRTRPAVRADLLDVYRIERASFPQPWPYAAFDRFLGAEGFLVAEDAGEVVGYVVAVEVRNHGRALGHVKDLAVRPDRREEGIASRLLEHALYRFHADGVGTVKLEVREGNEAARSLYRRFGFESLRTVPGYYADGEAAVVMVRDLGARRIGGG